MLNKDKLSFGSIALSRRCCQCRKFKGLCICSFQKNAKFLRSFTFFIKERFLLCVLLHSLEKNAAFFAFFYILYKRMRHSLRSFTFFIKECGVLWVLLRSLHIKERGILCILFGFISHTKMTNLPNKRT